MRLIERFRKSAKSLTPHTKQLVVLFPGLGWKLRKARLDITPAEYMAVLIAAPTSVFLLTFALMGVVHTVAPQIALIYVPGVAFVAGAWFFLYIYLIPDRIINKKQEEIDKDLRYMLRDMQVQLSAGIPLFNVLENISVGGYGECSKTADEIVEAIEAGRNMVEVLNDYGLLSPSEYMRRILGQTANALKTGSDLSDALEIISWSLQLEREDSISRYGQELAVISLMYMIVIIVMPSMGVALAIILTSFFAGGIIDEMTLYAVAGLVIIMELFFISVIKSRRPNL